MADVESGASGNPDDAGGFVFTDPASVAGTAETGETGKRRRGRPRKESGQSGANETASRASPSLSGVDIGDILKSIHALLAAQIGEHWAIDENETKQLDKAIKRALKHQDMKVTQKQIDYAFLAYVLAQVYGTRIVTTIVVKTAEHKKQAPASTPNIFAFPAG